MVTCIYYDGKGSQRQSATLTLNNRIFYLTSDAEQARQVPFQDATISEKLGNTPRQLHFKDGAYCMINDHAGFEAMLQDANYQPQTQIAKLDAHWRYVIAAIGLSLGLVVAFYQWGLPWAAQLTAEHLPVQVIKTLDEHSLAMLDKAVLEPSKLPSDRQKTLQNRFSALLTNDQSTLTPPQLLFRSAPQIGPNAFAMAGGTVVLLDELVALADTQQTNKPMTQAADDEVLGSLAHELGHAHAHHALRQLLQGSVVALAMTWYIGDVSSTLAMMPTLLLQTNYSRDFEREADNFAIHTLQVNHIDPMHLAHLFKKLETYADTIAKQKKKPITELKSAQAKINISDYLMTHPAMAERIQYIESTAKSN
jgi:Zn-dependent protease with chaperone function